MIKDALQKLSKDQSDGRFAHNGQGLLQGWNSCCVRPEPLLIKDIKVQVNKQKPNNERPAQIKHNSDKMPNCSNVQPALQQTQCWWFVPY